MFALQFVQLGVLRLLQSRNCQNQLRGLVSLSYIYRDRKESLPNMFRSLALALWNSNK